MLLSYVFCIIIWIVGIFNVMNVRNMLINLQLK